MDDPDLAGDDGRAVPAAASADAALFAEWPFVRLVSAASDAAAATLAVVSSPAAAYAVFVNEASGTGSVCVRRAAGALGDRLATTGTVVVGESSLLAIE